MHVMYVSFGSKVMHGAFGCVAMGSAAVFILGYIFLVWSAGSGVQVVLSGISVRLLCFVKEKLYVGMVVCISLLHSCLCMLMLW